MAQWQIMKNNQPMPQPIYDDGLQIETGDPAFSDSAAMAYSIQNGGNGVSYVGPSAPPED